MTNATPEHPATSQIAAATVENVDAAEETETSKPRWAGFEPLENPRIRIKIKPPRTNPLPRGHWFVAAVFVVASAAYVVACCYFADVEHQGVGLLQRIVAGDSVPPTERLSWLNRAVRAYDISLVCFGVIFFGCFIWMAFLKRRVGRRDFMANSPARIAWLVGVIVSVGLNLVSQGGSLNSTSDLVGAERLSMWFYLVRAVVGVVYLWMFVSLARRSAALLRADATPQPAAAVVAGL